MSAKDEPSQPGLAWRVASSATIGFIGLASKAFLNLGCTVKVHGLDKFIRVLDERREAGEPSRGLITVSNHTSVVDDPVIWGVLPFKFMAPEVIRWSLGSHDICFKDGPNSVLGKFFMLGQTLPTHRGDHSPYGGPFQPTITQCIRLLSSGPIVATPPHPAWTKASPGSSEDPFSDPSSIHTYSTTGLDSYPAPSSYLSRRHSWVHIFPEGRVHQQSQHGMRYFKWGVARLILESEPCPDVVPMFVEGLAEVMPEDRPGPRWIPRFGKTIGITFGDKVGEEAFGRFRERWKALKKKAGAIGSSVGDDLVEELRTGTEVQELRIEVAKTVRDLVAGLRRQRGYPNEDPKTGYWETWRVEGLKKTGRMEDDSLVGET